MEELKLGALSRFQVLGIVVSMIKGIERDLTGPTTCARMRYREFVEYARGCKLSAK